MPKMSALERDVFVRDFLKAEAKRSIWLNLLIPLLIPIIQRLIERLLQKEAE